MLQVENLGFTYGKRIILSEVSFSVASGEIVAVLGQNGSGKSTMLRCLNRILKPGRGTVFLNEKSIASLSLEKIAESIAYVPQRLEAAPVSVFEAVLLGRKPYFSWAASESDVKVVEEILNRLGLASLATRPTNQLSGGEVQKVALGRALVQEPNLLLLDEPTSALDLKNQVEFLQLLQEIVRERNITAIFSMHDINTAIRYADRFLLLRQGRLIGDVRQEGLTSTMIESVYGLPVEIHNTDRNISFVIEKLG